MGPGHPRYTSARKVPHTRRLPTDDQNDTDKRQDKRAFTETGVDCTGQVLTHTWNLTDSVFDVRRYTENPVPERS